MAVAMTPRPHQTPEAHEPRPEQLALDIPVVQAAETPEVYADAAQVWRLDDRTKEIGRVGVAHGREIIRRAEQARRERHARY